MKKSLIIIFTAIIILSFCSCEKIDFDKADNYSLEFMKALLSRDEAAMKAYLHPDYTETAIPDDEFYEMIEQNYFITVGTELAELTALDKSYAEDTELSGKVIQCLYFARIDELFYNYKTVILENENGYGIIAVSVEFNTDPELYYD